MSTLTVARDPDTASQVRADQLRSEMYARQEFMLAIRTGYESGQRGAGIPVDDYFRNRGITLAPRVPAL